MNINSIEPPKVSSNSNLLTLAGGDTIGKFNFDFELVQDVETDKDLFGDIYVMKQMPGLDLIFTGNGRGLVGSYFGGGVRVFVDGQFVHTLRHKFKSNQSYPSKSAW